MAHCFHIPTLKLNEEQKTNELQWNWKIDTDNLTCPGSATQRYMCHFSCHVSCHCSNFTFHHKLANPINESIGFYFSFRFPVPQISEFSIQVYCSGDNCARKCQTIATFFFVMKIFWHDKIIIIRKKIRMSFNKSALTQLLWSVDVMISKAFVLVQSK